MASPGPKEQRQAHSAVTVKDAYDLISLGSPTNGFNLKCLKRTN